MSASFPFAIDPRGRTADSTGDRQIRDLIEQVLFTAPGERVMRPSFGSGIYQLVFAPASSALAATAQHTIHAALQTWLSDRIKVEGVEVEAGDGVVRVDVRYRRLPNGESQVASFERVP